MVTGLNTLGKMASRPPAPDSLPGYITEGVPKQDDQSLRDLQAWIDDLLAYREEQLAAAIDADETIDTVEQTSEGTVIEKYQLCGKDNCKCVDGALHGPYRHRITYVNGETKWEYLGR